MKTVRRSRSQLDDTHVLIPPDALRLTIGGYSLNRFGTHGLGHWARVLENGLRLAEHTEADRIVVSLFAVLHDCRRVNEGTDRGHGLRSSHLAKELLTLVPELTEDGAEQLRFACAHHTDGTVHDDPTIATCWDADRLDLGRVGIRPRPALLCTAAAPAFVPASYRRPHPTESALLGRAPGPG
jgi:uncharacterized protein